MIGITQREFNKPLVVVLCYLFFGCAKAVLKKSRNTRLEFKRRRRTRLGVLVLHGYAIQEILGLPWSNMMFWSFFVVRGPKTFYMVGVANF